LTWRSQKAKSKTIDPALGALLADTTLVFTDEHCLLASKRLPISLSRRLAKYFSTYRGLVGSKRDLETGLHFLS
jgi:hypothetical protein